MTDWTSFSNLTHTYPSTTAMSNPRPEGRMWPSRRCCAAQSKVLCGPLFSMYNTMTTCLYFYNLKFDICDAMIFTAWLEEAVNSIDFSHSNRKRGEPPSVNLLAGPDTPPVCVPFQQIPSLHNSWRTAHTRPGTTSLVNKEVSDLRKVPTPKWGSISGSSTPEENQEHLRY